MAAYLGTRKRGAAVLIGIPARTPCCLCRRSRFRAASEGSSDRSTARRSPSGTSLTPSPSSVRAACRSIGSSRIDCRSTRSGAAFELMHSGDAVRVVLDLSKTRRPVSPDRAGRHGSARAGAARRRTGRTSTSSSRAAGARPAPRRSDAGAPLARPHTRSRLRGRDPAEYEPVWPPTLMMNKGNRGRGPPPDDHLGSRTARDRPGSPRRGGGRAAWASRET